MSPVSSLRRPSRSNSGLGPWVLVILLVAGSVALYILHRRGLLPKPELVVASPVNQPSPEEPEVEVRVASLRDMVLIPGGTFLMGGTNADEQPIHAVAVNDFWMDRFEMTNKEFEKFMPSHRAHRGVTSPGDNDPAIHVTWEEAKAYCQWRTTRETAVMGSCRLPTEAEWEYAARAGLIQKEYPWGTFPPDEYTISLATYKARSLSNEIRAVKLARVGTHPPNGFGLHDMAGNVWEWCQDWYGEDAYAAYKGMSGTVTNPPGPSTGVRRVWRGGSWLSEPRFLRCATRGGLGPDHWMDTLGFRCVRVPPAK